jgi:hypothetical protein
MVVLGGHGGFRQLEQFLKLLTGQPELCSHIPANTPLFRGLVAQLFMCCTDGPFLVIL